MAGGPPARRAGPGGPAGSCARSPPPSARPSRAPVRPPVRPPSWSSGARAAARTSPRLRPRAPRISVPRLRPGARGPPPGSLASPPPSPSPPSISSPSLLGRPARVWCSVRRAFVFSGVARAFLVAVRVLSHLPPISGARRLSARYFTSVSDVPPLRRADGTGRSSTWSMKSACKSNLNDSRLAISPLRCAASQPLRKSVIFSALSPSQIVSRLSSHLERRIESFKPVLLRQFRSRTHPIIRASFKVCAELRSPKSLHA